MRSNHPYFLSLVRFLGLFLLPLLTSLLLIISFPNFNLGSMAWIALIPLIVVCHGQSPLKAFILGLLSGVAAIAGTYCWMFEVTGFRIYHALILGVYLGLYPAVWCLTLSLLRRDRESSIIIGPAIWVALDFLKAHAGFMAFSWATLAQSQYDNIAGIQLAAFTGEYGITFLIVMANVALAEAILKKNWRYITATATIIALVHAGGFIVLSKAKNGEKLTVAVVQPSILRSERHTANGRAKSLDRLERLTISAAASNPVLVVWPETAVRDLKSGSRLFERLTALSKTINAPILTGASEFMKFSKKKANRDSTLPLDKYQYNSAYFVTPKETPSMAPYRKRILVPFGEYLPMTSFFKWPSWLVPEVFNVFPGDGYKHFPLAEGRRVSPIICWESLFADYVRLLVKKNTDLVVQLTNDNWFGRTAAPHQHNMASVFRAVENRVPVLIASNTGPSQIIDPFGRITSEITPLFAEGVLMGEVGVGYKTTFYTQNGDVFAFICLLFIGYILITLIYRIYSSKIIFYFSSGTNVYK